MCSVKKGVLRNFAKSTGKHLCQSLFFTSGRLLLIFSIWNILGLQLRYITVGDLKYAFPSVHPTLFYNYVEGSLEYAGNVRVCGKFPDWTAPRLTLPRGQFPDWHFPDGHFPERTIPRPDTSPKDTSPTGHFPTKTFPRPDISLTTFFSENFFFKSFFVCLYQNLLNCDTKLWLESAIINKVEKDMD